MLGIDQTIGEVERLYRTVTGQDVPKSNGPYAPIPAERDPSQYVMEQIDRLSQLLGAAPFQSTSEQRPTTPPLSVYETKDEFVIAVQMPGVSKDGLHVEARGRVVFVTGTRHEVATGRVLVAEHPMGPYQRIIPVPEGVTTSDLSAHIADGVLELHVRKKNIQQEARDIPVR